MTDTNRRLRIVDLPKLRTREDASTQAEAARVEDAAAYRIGLAVGLALGRMGRATR